MVVLVEFDREMSPRFGKRNSRRSEPLITYDVLRDGVKIGRVGREMYTLEKSTPGRMYVDRRWQSPRWFYSVGSDHKKWRGRETKKEALAGLIHTYDQEHPC